MKRKEWWNVGDYDEVQPEEDLDRDVEIAEAEERRLRQTRREDEE